MAGDDGVLARLHQVSKAYGKVAALQGIDLALRRGGVGARCQRLRGGAAHGHRLGQDHRQGA